MSTNSTEVAKPFKLLNPGTLDGWYGPYESVATACATVPTSIRLWKTVGIVTIGGIVEYWWLNGTTDSDLIPKSAESSGWSFSKLNEETKVEVYESTPSSRGYIKLTGTLLVFNAGMGYYLLNSFEIPLGGGNDLFYLSKEPTKYIGLDSVTQKEGLGTCYVLPGSSSTSVLKDKIVIGMAWGNGYNFDSIFNIFAPKRRILDFYITKSEDSFVSKVKNEDGSATINITGNRLPVFPKGLEKVFFIKPGSYTIPNGHNIILMWDNNGVNSFTINGNTPHAQEFSLFNVNYSVYDSQSLSSNLGIVWQGQVYSEHQLFTTTDREVIFHSDLSVHIPTLALKENLRPFFVKLDALTDDDDPLEVRALGDSITNFQHGGIVKADRTEEPQGLYGDTYLRWLWRRLNFTFDSNDQDQVAKPFSIKETKEWGNLRFLRADHSSAVRSSEFTPCGTRTGDGNKIYWSRRQYINGLSTCLGGFRLPTPDAGTKATSIGEISLHNHVYFFNDQLDGYIEYTIPANAKGFTVVFWGDDYQAAFPKIEGGEWEYLTYNAEVSVNGIVVGNIDQTALFGQSRVNFRLPPGSSSNKIRITNKSAGRTMNLWGIEYWTGKCVRLSNYAAAGNQASSFYNNPAYMIDKNADLIFWQTTTLNNVGGFSQVAEHLALGNLLKAKNVPIFATTCHAVLEQPTLTNYPEVAKANPSKVFQHRDAYAAQKALFNLGIPFVDAFNAFVDIAEPHRFTGEYAKYFIDEGHLSVEGEKVYMEMFEYIFSWKKSIK